MRQLDQATRDATMPADAAGHYEKLLGSGSLPERSWIASYIGAAGSPEYLSAFSKRLADPQGARDRFTDAEVEAVRRVHEVAEMRAMTLTDSQGGFLIPAHLDPAILLSSSGFQNPIREMARVVQIVGDVWHGVASEGASARWAAEGTEANDDSPALSQPNIPVYKGDSFVPYSVEIEGDGAGFVQEVSRLMIEAIDNLWATAYVTGSGVGGQQPTGFVTSLAATGAPVVVTGDGSEVLDDGDPVKLQNLLPPRAQASSAWAMALPTINKLRFAETSNGALLYPSLQNDVPTLLGRRVFEVSTMDSDVNAAATDNNYLIALGDWSRFVIVDRVGTQVEVVQHLVGANRRPTGQRGFYAWFRTGSNVVTTSQFRLLNVPTTA
ncbi:MAG: phage major capsid protein [Dietzia sp.]|nr:phage major capsid protein [Dietzia sp.]